MIAQRTTRELKSTQRFCLRDEASTPTVPISLAVTTPVSRSRSSQPQPALLDERHC